MKTIQFMLLLLVVAFPFNQKALAGDSFIELFEKAKKKSYSLKGELLKLQATEDGVSIARSRLYPSAQLSSALTAVKGLDTGDGAYTANLRNSIRIDQVIFDRNVYHAIKLAKFDTERNKIAYAEQERKFAISFAQLYLSVLTQRVQYLLLQQQYDIIDELIEQADEQKTNDNIKEALWTILDTLAVAVTQNKAVFENSASKLKAITGSSDIVNLYYPDEDYNFVANKSLGRSNLFSKLVSEAMTYNPDIQMSGLNSQAQFKKYQFERLPPISLRAFAEVSNNHSNFTGNSFEQNEAMVGVVFSLSLDFGKKKRKEQQQKLYQVSLASTEDVKEAVKGMINDSVTDLFAAFTIFDRLNTIDKRYHPIKSRVQIAKEGLDEIVDNFESYSKDLSIATSKLQTLSSYISTILQDKQIKQSILIEELNIIQLTGKLDIQGVLKEVNSILKDPYPLDQYKP